MYSKINSNYGMYNICICFSINFNVQYYQHENCLDRLHIFSFCTCKNELG